MALTVEDGTGVAGADALDTLAAVSAHFAAYAEPTGWSAASDSDKEAAIRRASSWLSSYFRWKGSRVDGRSQGLAWPRSGVTDCDGNAVPTDEVPIEVKRALYAATSFEFLTPGGLTPTVTPAQQVRRQKVGPIEREFFEQDATGRGDVDRIDDSRPVIATVLDNVRCLVSGVYPTPYPVTA